MKEKKDTEDKRISKSKNALKRSLLLLMKKKPVSKISIKELCICADLNRSTFYANYSNIYELLFDIYHDIFLQMDSFLKTNYVSGSNSPDRLYSLTGIIGYIRTNQEIFQILLANNGSNLFEKHLTDYYMMKYLSDDASITERYTFLYHSIGSFTLIHQWMSEGCPCTEENLAQIISGFQQI